MDTEARSLEQDTLEFVRYDNVGPGWLLFQNDSDIGDVQISAILWEELGCPLRLSVLVSAG